MLPSPALHLGNGTVNPLNTLCWEFNEVLKLWVCAELLLGGGARYPRLLNVRPVRACPAVAHEVPSSRGSRPLPLAGPFQSPCVLASWTSCVRTASSASSSPWCVTASSSAGMAPTRTRSSQDAVSRGCWRDSGGGPPWARASIQFSGLHRGSRFAFSKKGSPWLLQRLAC